MAQINDLRALLQHELEDLYSAETQLIEALPKMAERATDSKLKKALNDHLKVTRSHKKRLDDVQKLLGNENASVENKGFFARLFSGSEGQAHCKAMEGLIKEANSLMGEDMNENVMDAALIAAAQKVEHYEISSYGTARAYALQIGEKEVANLLGQTLNEEYEADDSLTRLALGSINAEAEDQTSAYFRKHALEENAALPKMKGPDAGKEQAAKKTSATTASKKTAPATAAPKKAAPKKSAPKKAAPKKATATKAGAPSKRK